MAENEIWKWVVGYEGLYEVSNIGRVRSYCARRKKLPFIMSSAIDSKGYAYICLLDKQHRIHRILCQAFLGNAPDGKTDVNHKNGIRTDNRLENLEYVSRSENVLHAYQVLKRTVTKGESIHRAKLTPARVIEIRSMRQLGMTFQAIADIFNVRQSTVINVCSGKTWSHVE